MHRNDKRFSKKKESKLTSKYHKKQSEESQKLKVDSQKFEEGFRQK
jgi:hypothetical protein